MTEVKVPTLGESITEATLGAWLKQPGEAVAQDEPIASLETDKVAVEVPSPVAGTMGDQLAKVGDTVAVGAVIRGATPHFDHVANEVSKGVAQASLSSGVPIAFGVLTTDSIEQAVERAGTKAGNKGFDAAVAAIEMVTLGKALAQQGF